MLICAKMAPLIILVKGKVDALGKSIESITNDLTSFCSSHKLRAAILIKHKNNPVPLFSRKVSNDTMNTIGWTLIKVQQTRNRGKQ